MDYRQKAREYFDYTQQIRRQVHSWAELGFDLPKTVALVESELDKMGISHQRVGKCGVSAVIGLGE